MSAFPETKSVIFGVLIGMSAILGALSVAVRPSQVKKWNEARAARLVDNTPKVFYILSTPAGELPGDGLSKEDRIALLVRLMEEVK